MCSQPTIAARGAITALECHAHACETGCRWGTLGRQADLPQPLRALDSRRLVATAARDALGRPAAADASAFDLGLDARINRKTAPAKRGKAKFRRNAGSGLAALANFAFPRFALGAGWHRLGPRGRGLRLANRWGD